MLMYALVMTAALVSNAPAHVNYSLRSAAGVSVHVVTANLEAPKVKVSGVTSHFIGSVESPSSLISRAQPTVALTGTFHSTRSHRPVGDIVIDGRTAYRGHMPSVLGVDWFNKARVLTPPRGRTQDWRDYEFVLGAGIRIVRDGRVGVEASLNRDGGVLKPNPRTAVGVTAQNKLLLVATREKLTLSHLGEVCKALGAKDAICLDGGSSVCLYYRGKMVVPSSRKLTNMLVVYENSDDYRRVKSVLGPW